ncbi:MAG TPA: molybdenum cofactor guanylyltransferase [Lentimicrobium sp.]|jgi:molybdopterin-guanine dinucleotide biosynthesis protein A|nr:molybdenum cofactor guanylyltransferase [Lentimicrobium sp.]
MKKGTDEITGIILAGGKSTRMGNDKALTLYKGEPMISYSIKLLQPFCNRILISTTNSRHKEFGFETIEDLYPDTGPMGGLFSCMAQSRTQANICLPCDVPEMRPEIIERLFGVYDGTSCIIPLTPKAEPLIAIYPRETTPVMLKLIQSGKYKMTSIFENFPVTYVDMHMFNSNHKSAFANINKPDDLLIK